MTLRFIINAEGYGYERDVPRPMLGWSGPLPVRQEPPANERTLRAWARDASAFEGRSDAEAHAYALWTLARENMTGRRALAARRSWAVRWFRIARARIARCDGRRDDPALYSRPEGAARWP